MQKIEPSWTKNRDEWEKRYVNWCSQFDYHPCQMKNLIKFAQECGG